MRGLTTYLQAKGGSLLAAGLLVLVGAGAVLGVGIGLGSGVFDPSGFLGAGTDRQKEASLDAAFGIDQTESEGEATMEADEQEKPESPVPDVKDFNAVDYVPGNTGPSALSIVDGPAQGTLPGGNAGGEGSGGAGSGGAVGPVVDGEGDGASPDDPGPGPGPGPGPTPADPDPVVPELPSGLYEDMFDEPLPSFPEEGFVPAVPGASGARGRLHGGHRKRRYGNLRHAVGLLRPGADRLEASVLDLAAILLWMECSTACPSSARTFK